MDFRLKPVREDGVAALYAMHSDEASAWQAGVGLSGRSLPEFRARMLKKAPDTKNMVISAIWLDGEMVGDVSSFLRGNKREVGYWVTRAHWGKGVASKALPLFLPFVMDIYPKSPLYARVVDGNIASIKLLQKCGFKPVERDTFYSDVRGSNIEETLFQYFLE